MYNGYPVEEIQQRGSRLFSNIFFKTFNAPLWSGAKPWWRPGSKDPRSFKDLVLWNHLLLIKIYPPQPVMKLIQHVFFSKILSKFEFEVNFNINHSSLTNKDPPHLQITDHYVYCSKYTELKFGCPNCYTGF